MIAVDILSDRKELPIPVRRRIRYRVRRDDGEFRARNRTRAARMPPQPPGALESSGRSARDP